MVSRSPTEPLHPGEAEQFVIDVSGLRKKYGGKEVVSSLDLQVTVGEVYALLGPNGAGKTTTVEILEGIRLRTSGEVNVLGADPAHSTRSWRSRIGIVPQSTGAFDDLTVREVVRHFSQFYAAPLPVDEVIDTVALREKADAQCRSLSGGQKRRIDVALAIIGDPDLIFLDEPTTGLDPEARRGAWALVKSLAESGKTILLTTHYLDEVEALADRVGIVVAGRMVAAGTPADIGGRSTSKAAVCFNRGGRLAERSLPDLGSQAEVEADGATVLIRTGVPTDTARRLIDWSRSWDVEELPDFSVRRPTLEDTYLGLLKAYDHLGGGVPA